MILEQCAVGDLQAKTDTLRCLTALLPLMAILIFPLGTCSKCLLSRTSRMLQLRNGATFRHILCF